MNVVGLRVKPTVKYLSEPAIEAEAEKLLKRYEAQVGPIKAPPIPIEFIVTELLGFETRIENLDEPETVAFIDPNRKVICLNEQKSDYLNRIGPEFTWAHEIGHWELGHFEDDGRLLSLGFVEEETRILHHEPMGGRRPRHEIQADYFAGCLLMPKRLLLPEAKKLNLLKRSNIYLLKDKFKVSRKAMEIRLEKLRLVYFAEDGIYRDCMEAQGNRRLL